MAHRCVYLNGRYLAGHEARVSFEDRGYQFADGIYEVVAVHQGRFVDFKPHLDRLERSLKEVEIPMPVARPVLQVIVKEVLRRNSRPDGMIYIQITRGVAPRHHLFPSKATPSLLVAMYPVKAPTSREIEKGISVITHPDIRWKRCDIKSLCLLPNVLVKEKAHRTGGAEVWMIDPDGAVTEGASTNVWMVDGDGILVTRPKTEDILAGITRQTVMDLARTDNIPVRERPFTVREVLETGHEAFISGSTTRIKPVVDVDGQPIGNGTPGPITARLIRLYAEAMEKGGR